MFVLLLHYWSSHYSILNQWEWSLLTSMIDFEFKLIVCPFVLSCDWCVRTSATPLSTQIVRKSFNKYRWEVREKMVRTAPQAAKPKKQCKEYLHCPGVKFLFGWNQMPIKSFISHRFIVLWMSNLQLPRHGVYMGLLK